MSHRLLSVGFAVALALAGCASQPDARPEPAPQPTTSTAATTTSTPPQAPTATPPPPPSTTTPAPRTMTQAQQVRWIPKPGTQWQWQLTNPVDTSVDVPVYDVDSTYTDAATVAALHAKGRKVICYVNTGAWENFRPDENAFPSTVLGSQDGWPGEQWLDIRQLAVLQPIMAARFAACKAKGFDGIEADLVDAYTSQTGFPLTAADQLRYNQMLAGLAHGLGLSIGLKNDLGQVPQLVGVFDFAIDEQCFEYSECDQLSPFIKAGKAVFEVEYQLSNDQFCTQAGALGFSAMRKNTALDAPRWPC
ncbi:MAG TPA: endo alpha-1,4 polygalactosaminidase [Pseudonocardiaceae bacterium]|nr:endo alpha-1,4 polygalactosaminidase [Pseudonocardiaceae bacterium]